MLEIVISIVVSLIASFIWWILGQLYSFDTRKKINNQLILLRNDNFSYQKFLEQRDYDLSLQQCQRMLDEVGEIFSLIKPLTYSIRKRKLINTILNSLHYQLSRFQRYYIGYENETEKERCCERASRHLYVVGFEASTDCNYPDYHQFQSATAVEIELLSDLNQLHSSCRKILSTSRCFNGDPENIETRKKYFKDALCVEAFKDSFSGVVAVQFLPSRDVFTSKKFESLINSIKETTKKGGAT